MHIYTNNQWASSVLAQTKFKYFAIVCKSISFQSNFETLIKHIIIV